MSPIDAVPTRIPPAPQQHSRSASPRHSNTTPASEPERRGVDHCDYPGSQAPQGGFADHGRKFRSSESHRSTLGLWHRLHGCHNSCTSRLMPWGSSVDAALRAATTATRGLPRHATSAAGPPGSAGRAVTSQEPFRAALQTRGPAGEVDQQDGVRRGGGFTRRGDRRAKGRAWKGTNHRSGRRQAETPSARAATSQPTCPFLSSERHRSDLCSRRRHLGTPATDCIGRRGRFRSRCRP